MNSVQFLSPPDRDSTKSFLRVVKKQLLTAEVQAVSQSVKFRVTLVFLKASLWREYTQRKKASFHSILDKKKGKNTIFFVEREVVDELLAQHTAAH